MEINFWEKLVTDTSGLHLKQSIPDVAVFEKCQFKSWLYSRNGLLKKKEGKLDADQFLKTIIDHSCNLFCPLSDIAITFPSSRA